MRKWRGSGFDEAGAQRRPESLFVGFAAVLPALLLLACVGCSGDGGSSSTKDASTGFTPSGSPDTGVFTFVDDAGTDAGPLLTPCNPTGVSTCSTGFTCYAQHTSTSWWVDLYGTCTFDCNGQTYPLCDSLGGVCGCPVPAGATTANCSLDGGVSMVCVPAVKP